MTSACGKIKLGLQSNLGLEKMGFLSLLAASYYMREHLLQTFGWAKGSRRERYFELNGQNPEECLCLGLERLNCSAGVVLSE